MDYLSILKRQNLQDKALITDKDSFSYEDLIKKVEKIREHIDYTDKYKFIYEDLIVDQLCTFIAYSGTNVVPIIATNVSKNQDFVVKDIPSKACMGVMTSGSTGKSKLLWRSFNSWVDFFPKQNEIFNIDKNTVIFCQGSLAFTGNLNIYMSVLFVGGSIVATEKFAPKTWVNMMEQNKVNTIYLIPSKLLLLPKIIKDKNTKLKAIISGSQSMGKFQAEELKKVFPNVKITLYYGASELNYISYIQDDNMTEDKTCIGKPFEGVKIFIKDEEIMIDTPYGVEGIQRPFSLKDRGYIDECGNLHFLGRKDDICNLNGIKISKYKIENILKEKLSLEEVAITIINQNNMDIMIAVVVKDDLPKKSEIINKLRQYLSEYEIPKKFIKVLSLPKNESGKIDKLKLNEIIKNKI